MTDSIQAITNFAGVLKRIKTIKPIECADTQIELVTTCLRDIEQNYTNLWNKVGFPKGPSIYAYHFIRNELAPNSIAVCFGDAEEIPSSADQIHTELNKAEINIPQNSEIIDGPIGISYLIWNDPIDRTMGRSPFIKESLTVKKFFDSAVLYFEGIELCRRDVVEYAAYRLGYIHSTGDRKYRNKAAIKIPLFDRFNENFPLFKRGNINYLLLSIARDIALSSDTDRFLEAAIGHV